MSFSKAPLKRFNDHIGCAPPPGAYDLKHDEPKGAASFDKSERFRPVKPATPTFIFPSPSRAPLLSPIRRTMSADGLADSGSARKDKTMSFELKQQKLLEKELRSLVQLRGEQDRRLQILQEEYKKTEAKLLAAVREKTSLTANVTSLERQHAELKKVNEFLKKKVSVDATKKKINALTMEMMEARNNLDAKNKELNILRVNSEGQVKALEMDVKGAKDNLKALTERNENLEDLYHVAKNQVEESKRKNEKLEGDIREQQEEVRVLTDYLDTANEKIQDLQLKLKDTEKPPAEMKNSQHQIALLEGELRQKEEEIQTYRQDLDLSKQLIHEMEVTLESQELELKTSRESLKQLEDQILTVKEELQDTHATARQQEAALTRLREVLRRTEEELDKRVAHLEQRCLLAEEDRSKSQTEGLKRVEGLKAELDFLTKAKKEDEMNQIELQKEHAAITEELTKEKALVDSLTVLLMQERDESEQKMEQLKEELEGVLGELVLMEHDQVEMEKLRTENMGLEKQLNDTRGQLLGNTVDVDCLKEQHLAAMTELKDEHTNSLNKMEAALSELQRTKETMIKRQHELEAEVERATSQLEEMDNVMKKNKAEIKQVKDSLKEHLERLAFEEQAKEEHARKLLEVRTCLVQKEQKMKESEESHAALISELRRELEQLKEKGDALGQLEAQTGQTIAQLQNEKETAYKLLEDVSWEKEAILKRAEEEKREKVEIEMALKAERNALEAVREDCEHVRSEVGRLRAEIQQAKEEKALIMSQLEQSKETLATLENRVEVTEQVKAELEARLEETERGQVFQSEQEALGQNIQTLTSELEEQRQERRALQNQVEVLTQEKVTLQWEVEEQRQELRKQIGEAQDKSDANAEAESWKRQYEELLSKVGPFQVQLNAFAAERNALLNENGANQEELNKLSDAYARLLGHQNQKQKIKHVVKLKDENLTLKQELSKLRTQVSRQKSAMELLKTQLPGAQRKFDPSKAFQHNKENMETARPLKEGNRPGKRSLSTDN